MPIVPNRSVDYVFVEYPKWLHFEGKPSVLVNTREEEDQATADADQSPSDERGELMSRCDMRGIKYDKRWGTEKLRAALE